MNSLGGIAVACLAVLAATVAALTTGCTSGDTASDESGNDTVSILKPAQKQARHAALSCAKGACTEGVGMLVRIETANHRIEMARCPLVLASASVALVDAECLPRKRHEAGAALKGRAWAVFAKTPKAAAESLDVAGVLSIEGPIAYLTLASATPRPAARLSTAGLDEDDELTVVHLSDPDSETGNAADSSDADDSSEVNGELSSEACRVSSGAGPRVSAARLEDCELDASDAGAPLLDKTGAVRALATRDAGLALNLACATAPAGLLGPVPARPCTPLAPQSGDDSR